MNKRYAGPAMPKEMPNLGRMTGAEFRKHCETEYGFTSRTLGTVTAAM